MKKLGSPKFTKIIIVVLLALFVISFYYFEPSTTLRILVILFGLIGLWQLVKSPEIASVLILYLAVYAFYNLHYGLSVPLAFLLVGLFALSIFLFFAQANLDNSKNLLEKSIFNIFAWIMGFSVLEFFLALDFLPINPLAKALAVTVSFYLFEKIFYLYANNVLNFRRTLGYIVATLVVFGLIIILNLKFGF
ncbi:MAG: hypothetical protein ABSE91_01855 [Patescibacteria group bacterium]|jgi:hypothetical protein